MKFEPPTGLNPRCIAFEFFGSGFTGHGLNITSSVKSIPFDGYSASLTIPDQTRAVPSMCSSIVVDPVILWKGLYYSMLNDPEPMVCNNFLGYIAL